MATATLASQYPWTSTPLIANAPMGTYAFSDLASEVSKAGGLGFVSSVFDMKNLDEELVKAREKLTSIETANNVLPVGVGFLIFVAKLEEAAPLIEKHRPAVVWFFAANNLEDYTTWTKKMREVSPLSKIWIQTGTVGSALQLARNCHPDVLVMQGSDAGGHGPERSASVISLLPEAADRLKENGFSDIALMASGGIADGRGVAAAVALGAEGVVMGTRFLAASETPMHPSYRKRILETTDGSQSTVRDKIFDELRGKNIWPVDMDGRAVVNDSYTEFKNGTSREDIQRLYAEAEKESEKGFGFETGKARAAVWAGAGIGLVNKIQPAGEIVREVRAAARNVLSAAAKF